MPKHNVDTRGRCTGQVTQAAAPSRNWERFRSHPEIRRVYYAPYNPLLLGSTGLVAFTPDAWERVRSATADMKRADARFEIYSVAQTAISMRPARSRANAVWQYRHRMLTSQAEMEHAQHLVSLACDLLLAKYAAKGGPASEAALNRDLEELKHRFAGEHRLPGRNCTFNAAFVPLCDAPTALVISCDRATIDRIVTWKPEGAAHS